jgi:hypothetical protein
MALGVPVRATVPAIPRKSYVTMCNRSAEAILAPENLTTKAPRHQPTRKNPRGKSLLGVFVSWWFISFLVPCGFLTRRPVNAHHNVDGILMPPEDPDASADAMARLMSGEADRRRLGALGLEVLERFSPAKVMGTWENRLALHIRADVSH